MSRRSVRPYRVSTNSEIVVMRSRRSLGTKKSALPAAIMLPVHAMSRTLKPPPPFAASAGPMR